MKVFKYIFSIPKTIYFNFKILPFKTAIKLPFFVHYAVKIRSAFRGSFSIASNKLHRGMIKFGCSMGSRGVFHGSFPSSKDGGGYIEVSKDSKIIFNGSAFFSGGFSLRIENGATMNVGNNFGCNSYCFFAVSKGLLIGDDCVLGWSVKIRDVDGHKIFINNDPDKKMINLDKEVIIGNKVWIGAHSHILKGSVLPNNSIVAYGSIITGKEFIEENCIIGGMPNRILKRNIDWEL